MKSENPKKEINLWDFVKDLSYRKKYILTPENEDLYVPFIVNRAFMQFVDTVLLVQELNMFSNTLTKQMHFDFLFNLIRPRKRFDKWAKRPDRPEEIDIICQAFNISERRAWDYYRILKQKNKLQQLKSMFNKGGKSSSVESQPE